MQILYIWDADYPWDVRVEKICKTLRDNGHEVHISARNLKKLPEHENVEGLYVHRLKTLKSELLNYMLSFPVFFNPVWKRFINNIIHEFRIQLIVVRDLPLAITGIWAGTQNGIPVIFDMAEDYVALIRDIWVDSKFKGLNLVVRNPYLARCIEKYAVKRFDHILIVVDEAVKIVQRAGGNLKKVTVVSNTPLLSILKNHHIPMDDKLKLIQGRFSAMYTGGIQLGRGIQIVLDAIPEIIEEIPDFLFVIVGDGYATDQLKKAVKEKDLQAYVLWIGWINHENILDYIRLSKVGLIPHLTSDHVNTTIPNKMFDYMGCGIPVIASDSVPMKRIMEEEKCGLTFKNGDAKDLAKTILELYRSDYNYGKNGMEAVEKKYNWGIDEKRLIEAIRKSLTTS
jgi:glycosyltransferase involved in cell wall biosynthesis